MQDSARIQHVRLHKPTQHTFKITIQHQSSAAPVQCSTSSVHSQFTVASVHHDHSRQSGQFSTATVQCCASPTRPQSSAAPIQRAVLCRANPELTQSSAAPVQRARSPMRRHSNGVKHYKTQHKTTQQSIQN